MRRIQIRENYGKTNPRAAAKAVRRWARPGGREQTAFERGGARPERYWPHRPADDRHWQAGTKPNRPPQLSPPASAEPRDTGRGETDQPATRLRSPGRANSFNAGVRDNGRQVASPSRSSPPVKNRHWRSGGGQVAGGGGTERSALIAEYAPLVKYLANRMAIRLPPSVSVDDLISSGIIGLLDAIEKFDPSRKVQFKTYAEFRIKGAILDELRTMDWVPRSIRKKVREIEKAIITAERKLNRPAEDSEVAEVMGIDLDAYYGMLDKARGIDLLSFDEYMDSHRDNFESKKSFKSLIAGGHDTIDHIMSQELKEVIADGIKGLPKKEQMVISLYYYKGLTLKEIGEVIGLTESRISQIHTKVIIKLRTRLRSYLEK